MNRGSNRAGRFALPVVFLFVFSAETLAAGLGLTASDDLVHELFPLATAIRSLDIELSARASAVSRLPLPLHYSELGAVTLQVVYEGRVPSGFVLLRPEASRWGLLEIAWALDLDLQIVGYRLERCRDRAKGIVEGRRLRSQLQGQPVSVLIGMLEPGGEALRLGALPDLPQRARPLAASVVRSGAKTALLAAVLWTREIHELRTQRFGLLAFPGAVSFEGVERHVVDSASSAVGALKIEEDRTVVFRALDAEGAVLGALVKSAWTQAPPTTRSWWGIAATGELSVRHCGAAYEPTEALHGKALSTLQAPSLEQVFEDPVRALTALLASL